MMKNYRHPSSSHCFLFLSFLRRSPTSALPSWVFIGPRPTHERRMLDIIVILSFLHVCSRHSHRYNARTRGFAGMLV
ncbi:hypothetical protein F4859DRAFT_465435 [Xylaria cf. heliscus]|nr:hypothetical protein F4859DRAFT_465435 [Xylaria cf. heliscus]